MTVCHAADMHHGARTLTRLVLPFAAALWLAGCTRFEDHASLGHHSNQGWFLTWTIVARRGIPIVDSGNVGSASATFPCRPDPDRPLTWIVEGPASSWQGSGAASTVLGPVPVQGWRGTVILEPHGKVHSLTIDLREASTGRPFVGNRRFLNARGNGETWIAN